MTFARFFSWLQPKTQAEVPVATATPAPKATPNLPKGSILIDGTPFNIPGKRFIVLVENPRLISKLTNVPVEQLTAPGAFNFLAYTLKDEGSVIYILVPNIRLFLANKAKAWGVLAHEAAHHIYGSPRDYAGAADPVTRAEAYLVVEGLCDLHAAKLGFGYGLYQALRDIYAARGGRNPVLLARIKQLAKILGL